MHVDYVYRAGLRPIGGTAPRRPCAAVGAFSLQRESGGAPLSFDMPAVAVGTAADADLQLKGPGVAPAHAKFTQKGKQLFLTALVGESVFDDSSTWIDGDQARPNVAYVLSNGSRVAFGGVTSDADGGVTSDAAFVVEFEEPSGANPLVEMLMQGAAAGASPEVRKALNSSE